MLNQYQTPGGQDNVCKYLHYFISRLFTRLILSGWEALDGCPLALLRSRRWREPEKSWVTGSTASLQTSSNSHPLQTPQKLCWQRVMPWQWARLVSSCFQLLESDLPRMQFIKWEMYNDSAFHSKVWETVFIAVPGTTQISCLVYSSTTGVEINFEKWAAIVSFSSVTQDRWSLLFFWVLAICLLCLG